MRILIVLLSLYILYQVFFRFILPIFLRQMVKKAGGMNGQFQQHQRRREGEVRIETPGSEPRRRQDEEYVDYVEIK